MSNEQNRNEQLYLTTMSVAKNLLDKGIISEDEYKQIDTNYRAKYSVSLSTLFTDISLINLGSRANM